MNAPLLLLPMPGFEPPGGPKTGVDTLYPDIVRFDNGELEVRLPAPVTNRDCVVLGTGAPPADRLLELLLAADTAARAGARSVRALLPYLAYARQDRFEPGHSLAAAWLGRLLAASGVVEVTTVDVHSERAVELMGLPLTSLSPAPLFARALADAVTADTVVVAPDGGARERARATADALGVGRAVAWLDKERTAGGVIHKRVVGRLAREAIIVDDILDTGGTLLSCCAELRSRGVEELTVAVTHGLFTGTGWRELADLGVGTIHTTDSVPGARASASDLVRVHSIAPLVAEALASPSSGASEGPGAHAAH